jgi:hypothetical protein
LDDEGRRCALAKGGTTEDGQKRFRLKVSWLAGEKDRRAAPRAEHERDLLEAQLRRLPTDSKQLRTDVVKTARLFVAMIDGKVSGTVNPGCSADEDTIDEIREASAAILGTLESADYRVDPAARWRPAEKLAALDASSDARFQAFKQTLGLARQPSVK